MKKITIIGGGASGTLLAVNLIKNAGERTLEINLVDRKENFGRVVAYSTEQDFHLLNVPANKMGAFLDRLKHFHGLGFVYQSFYDEMKSQTRVTDLLKIVRLHCEKANAQNSNWRAVIDSLRPHTQAIWRQLPELEKRIFMQHLSRYWNVARHRIPPECAEVLDQLQARNQLRILKGRLKNIETNENGKFHVFYSFDGAMKNLSVGAIFNCIGSESNFKRVETALVKNLMAKGAIKNDRLNLGIDATPDGKIINCEGKISDKIFAVGTALKGVLWESTAMPEIRAQTYKLALALLD